MAKRSTKPTSEPQAVATLDIALRNRHGMQMRVRRWRKGLPGTATPLFLLPNIDRDLTDLEPLAKAATGAFTQSRDVYALDWRGRGQSEDGAGKLGFGLDCDGDDFVDAITGLGLAHAHVIGAGYGGLVAMQLATSRPGFFKSLTMNDTSPRLDSDGIARAQYWKRRLGKLSTWDAATDVLKTNLASRQPGWSDDEWKLLARALFKQSDGAHSPLDLSYSKAFRRYYLALGEDEAIETQWQNFSGLRKIPMLIIASEHTSTLDPDTLMAMRRMRAEAGGFTRTIVAKGQGTVPYLHGKGLMEALSAFIDEVERSA